MDGSASESDATPDLPAATDDSIAVLHVDDDPDFADLTAELLERRNADLRVETATNASDGLAMAADAEFDCIVSDYDMPGRDGIEFLRAVRERIGDVPFILFTGKGSEEVASDAIAAGVTEYLQKGGGADQYALLANRIENAVSKYRAERDYRELFEKINDGIKIHDPETGEVIDVNQRFCEMLGYDREELLERSIDDFTHHGFSQADAIERIREAAAGEPQVFECVNETKGGEPLPVEVHLKGTRIGGRDRVLAVVRDITDRRERERALDEAADRMRLAIRGANSWVWEWNLDTGSIIQSAVTGILGVDEDEATRSVDAFLDEIHPADREEFLAGRDEAVDGDGNYHNEFRLLRDDEVRWIESRGQVYRDDSGDPDRLIGIATDVTERKEREREREWMQHALDQSNEAVFVSDPDTAAIEFVNDTACEQLGYDRDELLELTIPDIQPDLPDMAAWRDHIDGLRSRGHSLFEGEHVRSDGTRFPVEVNTGLVEIDGREYLLGVARDVTHRKERERELRRQIDRLEQLSEVISHDLRNPLNVAQGHIVEARERHGIEELDAARTALDRMEELIDEVLTMARQGRAVAGTEPVRLSTVAEKCWANVRSDTDVVVESDIEFEASPGRLQHVLENLFGNAVEHAGPGVTVRVGALDDGFYVEDDGPGIPPEEREAVFTPGYSTTDVGTGLGLTIVKQMAEVHGWAVRVTEGDAGGARFEITGVRGDR